MFTRNQFRKRIGLRYSKLIDEFVDTLCESYAEDYGKIPNENIGFDMIQYFRETMCDYAKEREMNAEIQFDTEDLCSLCGPSRFCNLSPVHIGGKRADGDVRDMGGKKHGESGASVKGS